MSRTLKKRKFYDLNEDFTALKEANDNQRYVYDMSRHLVAWWQLNRDISNTALSGDITDSSGNGHTASPTSDARRYTWDPGDIPSNIIAQGGGTALFTTNDELQIADSDSLSFGNLPYELILIFSICNN